VSASDPHPFASRGGLKLAHALRVFGVQPKGWVCADLGASTGGFTDCLLRSGAARVYSIERGYGVLAYALRNDPRVVVMERTDALHVTLPEAVQLVTIDAGWTRQQLILAVARRLLGPEGRIISLIKPHYEAPPDRIVKGVLPDELVPEVLATVREIVPSLGLRLVDECESPIRGHAGNREGLWLLEPCQSSETA
jgi:23S rRNA (cytidine1920-2'-O)/16S rRNA (cytidine1409-2'-O)-methyltransferase